MEDRSWEPKDYLLSSKFLILWSEKIKFSYFLLWQHNFLGDYGTADGKENNIHLELAQSRQCNSNCCNIFVNSPLYPQHPHWQCDCNQSLVKVLKNFNLVAFLHLDFHDDYQTGICQADLCFVGIDHTRQLILLCSCLAESNLLEFQNQPNLVYQALEKAAYKIYNKCAILADLSDLGIKRVKKMSFLSSLCLESCCLLCS